MRKEDFITISKWIEDEAGLHLEPKKIRMMDQRLSRLVKLNYFESIEQIADAVRNSNMDGKEKHAIVDALVTNETQFFRSEAVFEDFKVLIQDKLDSEPKNRINIWSAAASTGQEPYSIAMILEKMLSAERYRENSYRILATDISKTALEYAKAGLFTHYETQRGLNIREIIRWFEEKTSGWEIDESLKKYIRFQEMNLLKDNLPANNFDFIFLRHVLIYFQPEVRKAVISRMIPKLKTGGYLILGGTESLEGKRDELKSVGTKSSRIYKKSSETPQTHSKKSTKLDDIEWPFVK